MPSHFYVDTNICDFDFLVFSVLSRHWQLEVVFDSLFGAGSGIGDAQKS
jgi:hypothetical protein